MHCARNAFRLVACCLVLIMTAASAHASFHLMQIEQLIGGVDGDTAKQAIQLRMRSGFQNQVQNSILVSYDSAGLNPIVLIDFASAVTNNAAGDRILVCSAGFQPLTTPVMVQNFLLTNLIPANRLAAGRICFQDNFGTIYWSVAYGGAGYTGSNLGSSTNCNVLQGAQGNFGAAFAGPLPSTGVQALRFTRLASDRANANSTDYALTTGAAVWTNNARNSFTMIEATGACCLDNGACQTVTTINCASLGGSFLGAGSSCSACPLPMGACCAADFTCQITTQSLCQQSGGAFLGNNSQCSSCPQPSGACCLQGFTCDTMSETACIGLGGTYLGHATSCSQCPQPPPTGACCLPPGNPHGEPCHITTEEDCVIDGGEYRGDDMTCDEADCPPLCPCDWNGFDGLDSQDFFDFLTDFFEGNADFNGVDDTDSQDLFDFYECFFTGC